jgi:LPXTG-site transpeptidase (sortase) family protein
MKSSTFGPIKMFRVWNIVRTAIIVLALMMPFVVETGIPAHALAAGFSEYYIPGGADQLYAILADNDIGIAGNNLHSVITIPIAVDGVTVYYDHWENGYLTGAAGDEVYTANRGQVLTFESPTVPANPRGTSMVACAGSTNPNGATTNCYDGRDRIYVAGGAVAVAQAFWPSTTGPVYANAWEIYPTNSLMASYDIPVGVDLYGAPRNYLDFQNVYVLVQATQDGTSITIDNTNPAPGSDLSTTLNRGDVTQLYNIWTGTTVTANHPVQVQMIVGRQDAGFESRSYTIVPPSLEDTEYYSPVPSCNGDTCVPIAGINANVNLYVYNPSSSALSINYQDAIGSGTFSVPAGETRSYFEMTGRYVPNNSAVYLAAADGTTHFRALGSYDTGSPQRNWGFSLMPVNTLSKEYYVGWAPGTTDFSANGSPVFVTPTQDNTTIYVDYYPADGIADLTLTANRLQVVKLRDPAGGAHPNDNTGMHIWASVPIAVVWGEDALYANTNNPYIDAGYTVLPITVPPLSAPPNLTKALVADSLAATINPNATVGEIVTYEVSVGVPAFSSLPNAVLTDTLDHGLAFVDCKSIAPASPTVTTDVAGGFAAVCSSPTVANIGADPSDAGRNITFNLGTLTNTGDASVPLVIRYRVAVLNITSVKSGVSLWNDVGLTWTGGNLTTTNTTLKVVEPKLSIIKAANPTTASPGSVITFTLTVKYVGTGSPAYDAYVTDQIPTGLTYVPGSFVVVSGQAPVLNDTTAPNLRADWTVFNNTGTPTILQFQATFGGQRVVNTALLAWSSLPGPINEPQSVHNINSVERDCDPGSLVNIYCATSSASVIPSTPIITPTPSTGFIPVTGFASNRVTVLPEQPAEASYRSLGNLWLEVPKLGVKIPIVGVPLNNNQWDLSWLGNQAGYLEGTAFPTWKGNSAITAHVYTADGKPGPFALLKTLAWGDEVVIHAFGQRYVYQVRDNQRVLPTDMTVFRHEENPWVTLLTCQGYDQATGKYLYRIAVRAVLVRVEPENNSGTSTK